MLNLRLMVKFAIVLFLSLFMFGCGDGEYKGFDNSTTLSTPNKFLTFFNRQGDLAAGDYTLVVATAAANQTGSFSVSLRRNDGSTEELFSGNWTDSAGPSTTPASTCTGVTSNVCFDIDMQDATGGNFELTTSVDGILYLVDDSDTPKIVAEANANAVVATGISETLDFSESDIDETAFASAYYATIDPGNARDTLQKYQTLHGFDSAGPDVHVIFRDSKDLGYGRDMYMRSYPNPDCPGQVIAFYVRNFSVKIIDGFAYGPVNLEGAVNADLQHHFGSNAIEFSTGRSSIPGETCSPQPMAKFFTFKADYSTPTSVHPRLLRIDLDARGAKAMPQPCISCHGGQLRPLDRFGRFVGMHANDPVAQFGDTKSRLQAFEVDTFEFSDKAGHTQADYEDGLRQLNAAVYCTYQGSAGHPACTIHGGGIAAQTDNGEWSGDFGREMLLGWYDNLLQTAGTAYDESFVPVGWTPSVTNNIPGGVDALFKKVVGPNCFVCHGKRGNELGSERNVSLEGKDLDFSSWEKFISHASEIERLVYDEGKMPLGLLNYDNFWNDPEKAQLLASFIAPRVENFRENHIDANGIVIPPGRVVPRAGLDRVTLPDAAITLNAHASLFSDSYLWELISSPVDSAVTISAADRGRTDFSADMIGTYVVRLTARASSTNTSASDDLTIVVDNSINKAPRDLSFYSDITAELDTCATTCHSADATAPTGLNPEAAGVPVWWVDDASQPQGIPSSTADTPSLGLYEQAMVRVNLEFVEDSLLLKKPANVHHFGGLRAGFDTSEEIGTSSRAAYDMFVNWMSEGATCGGTTTQCPN